MTARPHRFTLRLEGERGGLLYDRVSHQYTRPTAGEQFLLLSSLDVPRGAALRILAQSIGAEATAVALASLTEQGVLEDDGPFQGRVIELGELPGAFGAPLVAHLGVTLACNFSCSHCYSSSGTRLPDELTLPEIEKLIEQMAAMGCCKLVLGGGEPFLRRELPQVIRFADALGIDTFVHTNASLLKPAVLATLAQCPPAGLSVSLDGATAETNDSIRGEGTFAQALEGIALLNKAYAPGFNVSVTIGPHNALEAPSIVERVKALGARTLMLRPQYPAGEAARGSDFCDRETFTASVEAARVKAAEIGMSLDAPHPLEGAVPAFDGFGCVAARVVLGITPNGRVTPCLNLAPSFESGTVREKSLLEFWKAGRSFVTIRGQQPNSQCASCKHYDTCRGGCRVRALFSGNGLNGPDSWCHYEPKDAVVPGQSTDGPQSAVQR